MIKNFTGKGKGTWKVSADQILSANYKNFPELRVDNKFAFNKLGELKLTGVYQDIKEVQNLALKALGKFNQFNKVNKVFSKEYTIGYTKFVMNTTIPITTNFPVKELKINAALTRPPKPLGEGIVYYMQGHVANSTSNGSAPINWDKFNITDGGYQYFVHQEVLNEVFSKMTENNSFSLQVTKANLPKDVPFDLTVESLSKIIPDISKKRPLDEPIKLGISLHGFDFSPDSKRINSRFNVNIHYFSAKDNSLLLVSDSFIRVQVKKNFVNNKLNFNFDKNSLYVKYSTAHSKWGPFRENPLNKFLKVGLKIYLKGHAYFIFNHPIQINKGAKFDIKYVQNRGSLLQIPSLQKKEFKNKVNEIEKQEIKAKGKFLQ